MAPTGPRPWVARGRSHEFEHNGRIGSRFATRERAMERAQQWADDGCWDVEVWYWPARYDTSLPLPYRVARVDAR